MEPLRIASVIRHRTPRDLQAAWEEGKTLLKLKAGMGRHYGAWVQLY